MCGFFIHAEQRSDWSTSDWLSCNFNAWHNFPAKYTKQTCLLELFVFICEFFWGKNLRVNHLSVFFYSASQTCGELMAVRRNCDYIQNFQMIPFLRVDVHCERVYQSVSLSMLMYIGWKHVWEKVANCLLLNLLGTFTTLNFNEIPIYIIRIRNQTFFLESSELVAVLFTKCILYSFYNEVQNVTV